MKLNASFLQKNKVVGLLLLFFLLYVLNLFLYKDGFGKLPDNSHVWLSGSTIKFAENCLEEGAWDLGFRMLECPFSIESQTCHSRDFYTSYPPGCVVPVYVFAKLGTIIKGSMLSTQEVTVVLQLYSLFVRTMLAVGLFVLCFWFLRRKIGDTYAFVCSLVSIFFLYTLSFSIYYHFYVYFSDQSVLWLFVWAVVLEIARSSTDSLKSKRILESVIFAVNLMGCATDWLFYFVMLVVFVKRIVHREFGRTFSPKFFLSAIIYCLPIVIVSSLFIYQILTATTLERLKNKFLLRVGATDEVPSSTMTYHISKNGWQFVVCYYGSILYYLYKLVRSLKMRQRDAFVDFYTLLLLPCILQMLFFMNHSQVHEFSALKTEIPTTFFVITVLFDAFSQERLTGCSRFLEKRGLRVTNMRIVFVSLCVFVLANAVIGICKTYKIKDRSYDVELFVRENTSFNDVVYSQDYCIPKNPPQNLAYSRKVVYQVADAEREIEEQEQHYYADSANFLILTVDRENFTAPEDFELLAEKDSLALYKKIRQ